MKRLIKVILLTIMVAGLAIVMVGCGGGNDVQEASVEPTPAPQNAVAEATPTPEPMVEPTPEPTAEPTPEPTAEPTPTQAGVSDAENDEYLATEESGVESEAQLREGQVPGPAIIDRNGIAFEIPEGWVLLQEGTNDGPIHSIIRANGALVIVNGPIEPLFGGALAWGMLMTAAAVDGWTIERRSENWAETDELNYPAAFRSELARVNPFAVGAFLPEVQIHEDRYYGIFSVVLADEVNAWGVILIFIDTEENFVDSEFAPFLESIRLQ